MSEISEQLESLSKEIEAIQQDDISHEELGTVNGFHDAQSSKENSCKYVNDILNNLLQHHNDLNDAIVQEKVRQIEQWVTQTKTSIQNIHNLTESGVHEANFPKQRNQHITAVQNQDIGLKKNLYPLELDLKLVDINNKLSNTDYFNEAKTKADDFVSRAEEAASKVQKVLDAVQEKTVHTGIEESAGQFAELVTDHSTYEKVWLWVAGISALILCVTVYLAIWGMPSTMIDGSIREVQLIEFIKRLILISVSGVFLRVSLTKYNTERGLKITYKHRQKVLDQYLTFEAGIGDDLDAKNQFRLEIAKYIFSDPQSGYNSTGKQTSTDININPIVSAVEKVATKKA